MDKHIIIEGRNGQKIRKHIRYESEEEFNKKVAAIKGEYTKVPKLKDVIDEWQDSHDKEINYNTQQCYIAPIKNIKEYFGNKKLDEIQAIDVDRFIRTLYQEYKWAKQTLKLRLIVLNQVYDYAMVCGYVNYNPCTAVKVPAKAGKKKRDLPPSSEVEIIKESVNDEFGLFPFLLLYTGCRRNEALALRYEDINWDDKIITINKTVIFVDGKPTIQDHTKTDAGNRTVPLLPPLENVLPKKKKGIIFEFEGGYYTRSKFDKSWNRFRKEHGVKLCAHQLRHAYATILYEAGIQFKDAQLLMGHNSSEVTQEIYTHISEKQQKKTFTNLINYVSGENVQ